MQSVTPCSNVMTPTGVRMQWYGGGAPGVRGGDSAAGGPEEPHLRLPAKGWTGQQGPNKNARFLM